MDKFIIRGGKRLTGKVRVSGAKNVALKAIVAASLTDEEVVIKNIPLISDFMVMVEILRDLGAEIEITDHTARIRVKNFQKHAISLDEASHIRTSSMFLASLLARLGKASIPNPGGCRLGKRPIDRTVEGLKKMGAEVLYDSEDGYFHARTESLIGTEYTFDKNTHTGTETLLLAAVLAKGKTTLYNAAMEPEIDELIELLNKMGSRIKRTKHRVIEIEGVEKLHGTEFVIGPDRNEAVTFAVAAIITKGDVLVEGVRRKELEDFLLMLEKTGAGFEEQETGIRFFYQDKLKKTEVTTLPYPGFMTDWQANWAVLMTQAEGGSVIHETVFENRFGYVPELKKMGAKIEFFNFVVTNPQEFYNFNPDDDQPDFFHAIKIKGPVKLHNAVVSISDLRAGATLVIAALAARGESTVHGISLIDRGYEDFEKRLQSINADIRSVSEKDGI